LQEFESKKEELDDSKQQKLLHTISQLGECSHPNIGAYFA